MNLTGSRATGKATRVRLDQRKSASQEFSLELVASTALHFVGTDSLGSDMLAADQAIRFLQACAESLRRHHGYLDESGKIDQSLQKHGWARGDHVSYVKGIKFLTGKNRRDRAVERYRDVIKKDPLLSEPLSPAQLNAHITEKERVGFTVQELLFLQPMFAQSKGRTTAAKNLTG